MKKQPKPNPQSAADKAFTGSDKHTLDDLKLEPWTPERIIKAQELGMVYPNLGKHGWAQYRQTNVYPGAVRDVMIFLFLCITPKENLDDATWQDAKAFGTKRGLHKTDTEEFWEAYGKFIEIHNEINASIAVPKVDGPREEPDDESGNV